MISPTKLKRKSTSLSEDILLLEVCVENFDCLLNLKNSCYKSLFWKTVTGYLSQCSDYYKNTRQIRDRFKRLYIYYTKIKNLPFFYSKIHSNDIDADFFKAMNECFSKIYYNKYGILTLIVRKKTPEVIIPKNELLDSFLNCPAPIDHEHLIQQKKMFSYMCEINNEGKYQTAAEMLYQFNYQNISIETGFLHKFNNTELCFSLNNSFIDD